MPWLRPRALQQPIHQTGTQRHRDGL